MKREQLLETIKQRELDISSYQINIDNYVFMIDLLPKTCPDHLVEYINRSPQELLNTLPFEEIQFISDFQFREKLEQVLLTEKLEQRKSNLVLSALRRKLEP